MTFNAKQQALAKIARLSAVAEKIPDLKFPANWQITPISITFGTMVHIHVSCGEHWASVRLDDGILLPTTRGPCWEVLLPNGGGVAHRPIEDAAGLLELVGRALGIAPRPPLTVVNGGVAP